MHDRAMSSLAAIGLILLTSSADARCKPNQTIRTKDCLNPPGASVTRGPGGIFIVVVPKPENYASAAQYLAAVAGFRRDITVARKAGTISQAEFDRGIKAAAAAPDIAQRRFPSAR